MIFRREFNLKNSQIAIGIVSRLESDKKPLIISKCNKEYKIKIKKKCCWFYNWRWN